jgi:hypothetical protein
MQSILSIDGRVGKVEVPGVARGPDNSSPVPVMVTTRFSWYRHDHRALAGGIAAERMRIRLHRNGLC